MYSIAPGILNWRDHLPHQALEDYKGGWGGAVVYLWVYAILRECCEKMYPSC